MGYTNRDQITNPLDNSNSTSLALWKAHYLELHDWLLAAGWVQTADTGQLDIDGIVSSPAKDVYIGYRMYEIDDDLSALGYKIHMKIEFGAYTESSTANYHNGTTPSLYVSLGHKTDGAGNLLSHSESPLGIVSGRVRQPQSANATANSSSFGRPQYAYNYVCRNEEKGFYGFVFYANGRGANWYHISSPYNAASFALFIQRSLNDAGEVTNDGFSTYMPRSVSSGSRWPTYQQDNSIYNLSHNFVYDSNTVYDSHTTSVRLGGSHAPPVSDGVQLNNGNTALRGRLRTNPNLIVYRSADLPEGQEFEVEVAPGDVRNFIALGPGTGMNPDVFGNNNSFAMLFE